MHHDNVFLVTGSSSGIGLATAKILLRDGARVAGLDIVAERNEEELAKLDPEGERTLAIQGDVSREDDNQRAISAAVEKFGRINGAALCAGINGVWTPIEKMTGDEWDRTMQINLKSNFLAIKALIKPLKTAGGGAIVLVSSIEGPRVKSSAGSTAYAVAKHGQITLMEKAAIELARYRIRVNAIMPGGVYSNIRQNSHYVGLEEISYHIYRPSESEHPLLQRMGDPEHIGEPISFLLSSKAEFVTGAALLADGAQSFMRG